MAEGDDGPAGRARTGGDRMSEEEVDYNVMGSFPASDPPSWTLGVRPHKTSRDRFGGEPPSAHHPSHQNDVDPPAGGGSERRRSDAPAPDYQI